MCGAVARPWEGPGGAGCYFPQKFTCKKKTDDDLCTEARKKHPSLEKPKTEKRYATHTPRT